MSDEVKETGNPLANSPFFENVKFTFQSLFYVVLVLGAAGIFIGGIGVFLFEGVLRNESVKQAVETSALNDIVAYCVSLVVLGLITYFSYQMTSEILESRKNDDLRKKADQIAVMVGLISVFALFKQPYLELLFKDMELSGVLSTLLGIGGVGTGWLVWYLKQLDKYGELFHVFLLVIVAGFGWYARLTSSDEVQTICTAFVVGSFFHLAKDYIDRAHLRDSQTTAPEGSNNQMQPTAEGVG